MSSGCTSVWNKEKKPVNKQLQINIWIVWDELIFLSFKIHAVFNHGALNPMQ